MLESLTPTQLQEWAASRELDPWPSPWEQTSQQIAETLNGFRVLLMEAGVLDKPSKEAWIKPDAYVPKLKQAKPKAKRMNLAEAEQTMRILCGV